MSYDPTVGRWTAEDPIAFEGGDANLYRYVGNSPVNATAPTGLARDWTNPGIIIVDPTGHLPGPDQALIKP